MIFTSDITVRQIQQVGGDALVVAAARVSTSGEEALKWLDPSLVEDNYGLIRYLMKQRHGCYDSETEVLTSEGWKAWPVVKGDEQFATLSRQGAIEYQKATRLIRKEVDNEPMVHVDSDYVNLLVTNDHNMLAVRLDSTRRPTKNGLDLIKAEEFLNKHHQILGAGGVWQGEEATIYPMEFLGLVAVAGKLYGGSRKGVIFRAVPNKLQYIERIIRLNGIDYYYKKEMGVDAIVAKPNKELLQLCRSFYTPQGKVIPRQLLNLSRPQLVRMYQTMCAIRSRTANTARIFTSKYKTLIDSLHELVFKIGLPAICGSTIEAPNKNHATELTYYRLRILNTKRVKLFVGNKIQRCSFTHRPVVTRKFYTGNVHCVTVPNGTLYVRRNGKACWCGNSPFEHGLITSFVHAPIMVFREWHRHRISSFSEESARYKEMEPRFWIPRRNRPIKPVEGFKSARPKFEPIEQDKYDRLIARMQNSYTVAYNTYQESLDDGVAKEVARAVLPVGLFSSCWVTVNPRSLMHFLSLRTHHPEAVFVSYPQMEIEEAAIVTEEFFKQGWPLTYKAFVECGRVAP